MDADDPRAVAATQAVQRGDLMRLRQLLGEHPSWRPQRSQCRARWHDALNWVAPWDELTPLDAARRSNADDLAAWLIKRGARSGTGVK